MVHIGAIELTDDDDEPPQRAKNIDTSIIDLCSSDDGPDKQKPVQKRTSKKPDISDDESLIVLSSENEDKSTSVRSLIIFRIIGQTTYILPPEACRFKKHDQTQYNLFFQEKVRP